MTKTTATVLIAAACASGAGAGVFQSSMIGASGVSSPTKPSGASS